MIGLAAGVLLLALFFLVSPSKPKIVATPGAPTEEPMEVQAIMEPEPIYEFQSFGGDWQLAADGSVSVESEGGPKLVCVHPDFQEMKSGEVSVEILIPGGSLYDSNAGILLKIREPGLGTHAAVGCEISANPRQKLVMTGLHLNGRYVTLKNSSCDIPTDKWFTLHVLFDETSFEVRIDDESVIKYEEEFPDAFRSGGMALRSWHGSATFRNLKIRGTTDGRPDEWAAIPFRFAPKYTPEEEKRLQAVRERLQAIPSAKLKTALSGNKGFGRFTSDGTRFVTGGKVFDPTTGKEARKLVCPHGMRATAIHPDGRMIASGTDNGNIVLWDVEDGKIMREIKAHEKEIEGLRFGPNGSFLVSGSFDKTAAIWDTATGEERRRLEYPAKVITVDVAPDGKLMAASLGDGSVRVVEIETGKESHRLRGHEHDEILALAFHPRGTMLASGCRDKTVVFWDVKTGQPVKRLLGCEDRIFSIDFSPDGSCLVLCCESGWFSSVWDVETCLPLYRLPTNSYDVTRTTTFSPDGNMNAICRTSGFVSIWEVPTPEELPQMEQDLKSQMEADEEISLRKLPPLQARVGWGRMRWGEARSAQGKHANSLYAHAPSRYVFHLGKRWKTFQTRYALDAGIAHGSRNENVIFIVKGDGRELFRSEEIRDYISRPLQLDVGDLETLELIVDPNGASEQDHAYWLTPTLFRSKPEGDGFPDIFHAAELGTVDDVKHFLDHGAGIDVKTDTSWTPLHAAAALNADAGVLKYLISRKADVRAKTKDSLTPLDVADTDEKKTLLRAAVDGIETETTAVPKEGKASAPASGENAGAEVAPGELLLKDMPPEEEGPLQRGRPMRWATFSSAKEKHENSLFTTVPSKHVFRCDKKWKRFQANYGLAKGSTSCTFIVNGDGRELYRAEDVHDQQARPLIVNIENVELLELIVERSDETRRSGLAYWFTPLLSQDETLAEPPRPTLTEHQIKMALKKNIDLDIDENVTFENLFQRIIKRHPGMTIAIDPKGAGAMGVTMRSPTVRYRFTCKDITLRSALRLILSEQDLDYRVVKNVLLITTENEAAKYPINEESSAVSAMDRRIQEALEKNIDLELDERTTFRMLFEMIVAKNPEINIAFDSRRVDPLGFTPRTLVTREPVKFKGVKLRNALQSILGKQRLSYIIKHEVLLITSESEAKKR